MRTMNPPQPLGGSCTLEYFSLPLHHNPKSELEGAAWLLLFLLYIYTFFRMINKQELIDVINAALEGSHIFLVEVKVSADNVVDVAIDSMESVTIDDCIDLNNKVLDHFDRDVEDFELTVGSYSISDPFKVLQQYQKNLGGEVEVLTRDGKKLKGILKDANEEGFTLTITKKVKLEGKKRPEMVDEDLCYKYDEIKYTKNIIQF